MFREDAVLQVTLHGAAKRWLMAVRVNKASPTEHATSCPYVYEAPLCRTEPNGKKKRMADLGPLCALGSAP